MKTLVLNVDRDDDFGRKAKVKSPIIGLKKNLEAANKLGEADPEDSDLNSIFSAISTYKQLKKEGKEAEVATICGHIKVGLKSDDILSQQLETVLKDTNADQVILLSDGAEDEYVLPIIESRIKISSVKRVSVKQSQQLEDQYYRFVKLLDDEKVQKQFLLPITLVIIVWGFFALLDMASTGFGAILLTLGIYLLIRVFQWERTIAMIWDEIKSGFLTGRLSLYTSLIAIAIVLVNGLLVYNQIDHSTAFFIRAIYFIRNMIWGIVIAGLIAVFGRVVDLYVREKETPWNYWVAPFSLFTFGFISSAVFNALYNALREWPETFDANPFFTMSFMGYTATGIMIALVGAVTYHYIKDLRENENREIEIEKETQKL
jgi:putative membrane protein